MAIHNAVSAALLFEDRLFVIKRQETLLAFPGYHAFPGGKVDAEDRDVPYDTPFLRDLPPRLARALCRELMEEVAFDLEAAIRNGIVRDVCELGTALTPDIQPHRFDTHFFKVTLNESLDLVADAAEAAASGWRALNELVAMHEAGRLLAVPPAVNLIHALADDPARRVVPDLAFTYNPETEIPCFEAVKGVWMLPVLSNTLLPATRTNAFVIGDALIDPSPRSFEERKKLMNTLWRFTIGKVFLTHHHSDHYEFAESIADELQVPLCLSADSHDRILRHRGRDFFKGLEVGLVGEGDTLTHWLGKEVKLYAVPGHDAGQLAPAPESMEWFIVGDLIQGVGTVVIAPPEGDMAQYFASLERVIGLNPAVIIPSHGGALGGVHRLRETLKHRKMRESQVLALQRQGASTQEMLADIYPDLDPRLSLYAMANIESHLAKLRAESRI